MSKTNLSLALSKCYKNNSNQDSNETAENIVKNFQEYLSSQESFNIILQAENYSDGIGDFKNLIDYYLWMEEIFQDIPKVSIKVFAYVCENKQSVSEKILPGKLKENNHCYYYDIKKKWDETKAQKAKIIIFTGYNNQLNKSFSSGKTPQKIKKIIESSKLLLELVKKTQFLLNIATPYSDSQLILKDLLPKDCFIHSRLEYGVKKEIEEPKEYTEDNMGFEQVGIKFDEKLYELQTQTHCLETKEKLLLSVKNATLLQRLLCCKSSNQFSLQLAKSYLERASLNFGYLQSPNAIEEFIKVTVYLESEQLVIDLITNTQFFKPTRSLLCFLKKHDIDQIQIINNDGKITKKFLLTKNKKTRALRLIEFSGMTQQDKTIFNTLSNITGASADNSFSDACGLPFFYMQDWKSKFMCSFVNYINKEFSSKEMSILADYVKTLIKCRYDKETYGNNNSIDFFRQCYPYIKENRKTIESAFLHFKKTSHQNKNAKIAFYELVNDFILNKLSQEKQENFTNSLLNSNKISSLS